MKVSTMWIGFLIFLVAIWEVVGRSAALQFVLPSPSAILEGLWDHYDRFALHSAATLREMLGGLALALLAAFPLAWLLLSRRSMQAILVACQCLPMLALAPLMVIWFGWTYTAVVVPTVLMIFFPLTVNIYQGLDSVPKELLQQFELWGASSWQILWRCRLPWALPRICSGLRIAAGLAGTGAVVAEWAGAQAGLGLLMLESRRSADLVTVFGAIVCLIVLTLTLYYVTAVLERMTMQRRPLNILWNNIVNRRAIVGATWAAAVLLLVCGYSVVPTQQGQLRLVLDWLPNPNHVPLFVGVEREIFKRHGIDLQILKVQEPGDVIPYLTSHQADIAVTYMPSLVMGAQARGADLSVVGYLIKEPLNSIILRQGADLNGCVLGCVTDGIQTRLVKTLLTNNGIKPRETINVSFDAVTAMLTGQVDAMFGTYWNIEGEHLRHWGFEPRIFSMEQLGVPHHFELILVAAAPSSDESFVGRFRSALQESIDWSVANAGEAFAVYAKANPDKTAKTLAWEEAAWHKTLPALAQNQGDEPQVWETYSQWLRQQGLITQ